MRTTEFSLSTDVARNIEDEDDGTYPIDGESPEHCALLQLPGRESLQMVVVQLEKINRKQKQFRGNIKQFSDDKDGCVKIHYLRIVDR